jgi:two-component system OmpR family response regulator
VRRLAAPLSNLTFGVCAMRILVAEDDAPLAEVLHQRLLQEQFAVQMVSTGVEAQRMASDQSYDLVVLDLNSHGSVELDVLRGIRKTKPDLPIIRARVQPAHTIFHNVGASQHHDYVAKPFAVAELTARIRAVLRRGNRPVQAMLQVNDLHLDRITHTVERRGHAIELSPKEFSLLELLMRHAGEPVSRSAIVSQVWKSNFDTMTNVVDVYINYLRRKVDFGYDLSLIRTIRGIGYQIGTNVNAV